MDTLKIGQYIQHLRKAAGMTQKELAEKLNISFQAVSKWENGDTLPDTGILHAQHRYRNSMESRYKLLPR